LSRSLVIVAIAVVTVSQSAYVLSKQIDQIRILLGAVAWPRI
jgi:hypothetical protein